MIRYVLAATLGSSYGIYGPAFELCDAAPLEPGREEYLNSEKYELRHWQLDAGHSIRELIARVNGIRRDNPVLHEDANLRFFRVDNEQLLCYGKRSDDDLLCIVVNLDPNHMQSGWLDLPLQVLFQFQDKDMAGSLDGLGHLTGLHGACAFSESVIGEPQ